MEPCEYEKLMEVKRHHLQDAYQLGKTSSSSTFNRQGTVLLRGVRGTGRRRADIEI